VAKTKTMFLLQVLLPSLLSPICISLIIAAIKWCRSRHIHSRCEDEDNQCLIKCWCPLKLRSRAPQHINRENQATQTEIQKCSTQV